MDSKGDGSPPHVTHRHWVGSRANLKLIETHSQSLVCKVIRPGKRSLFRYSFRCRLIRSDRDAEFVRTNSLTDLVVRDLNFIRYISTNRKIRNPGDCHEPEDLITQEKSKRRLRRKEPGKTQRRFLLQGDEGPE